jgi:hypothetical protein
VEAAALRPAQVHAQEHLGPVLRIDAAGTGLHRQDGIICVGFAGEQRGRLEPGDVRLGGIELSRELRDQRFALGRIGLLARKVNVGFQIAQKAPELLVRFDRALRLVLLLQNFLRVFLVLPEIGGGGLLNKRGYALAIFGGVKDSSGPARFASAGLRSGVVGLR